jgi:hypothetical protein
MGGTASLADRDFDRVLRPNSRKAMFLVEKRLFASPALGEVIPSSCESFDSCKSRQLFRRDLSSLAARSTCVSKDLRAASSRYFSHGSE